MPRVTNRQSYRSNTPAVNTEYYYRRNIVMQFLDVILTGMTERFGDIHQKKIKLLGLF